MACDGGLGSLKMLINNVYIEMKREERKMEANAGCSYK